MAVIDTVGALIDALAQYPRETLLLPHVYRNTGGGSIETPDTAVVTAVEVFKESGEPTVFVAVQITAAGDEPSPEDEEAPPPYSHAWMARMLPELDRLIAERFTRAGEFLKSPRVTPKPAAAGGPEKPA